MELARIKACICEGAAETAIIDILLDSDLLIFRREEMLDERVIRCRDGRSFETRYLRKGFNDLISVIRVLDSHREKFRLGKAYEKKVDVINVVTAPEIALYPEEFEICSHFEVTAAIPTVLFAVTTWKENGKPNVCFHAWSCFHGDKTAFFAVMGNLFQHTHTYANILREKCFCINFLPIDCCGRLVETIHQNEYGADEFAAGGFTVSDAKMIHAPVIGEAFVNMECTLKDVQNLLTGESGQSAIATVDIRMFD